MTTSYVTGTVSVEADSRTVIGSGTGWLTANIAPGFFSLDSDDGNPVPVESVVSDTELTLFTPWRGATATGQTYWLSYDTNDGQQTVNNAVRLSEYIARLDSASLSSIAGLTPEDQKLILFTGPNTAVLIGRDELGFTYDEQVPDLAARAQYDDRPKDFRVLVVDAGDGRSAFYIKNSNTSGDWSDPLYVTGAKGDTGEAGPFTQIVGGNTTTLPAGSQATVTPREVSPGVIALDFGVPKGADGTGTGDVVGPAGGVMVNQLAGYADTTGKLIKGLTPEGVRIFAKVHAGGYSGRDYLINGNFYRWLRGTTQSVAGYASHDRWQNLFTSSLMDSSRVSFTPGQTDVPGFPRFYVRTNWVPGGDNVNALAVKAQTIWDLTKFAGKRVTATFWARASYARPLPLELYQAPGSGGSPSLNSSYLMGVANVTTSWQKFSFTGVVTGLAGKTLGSNDDSLTEFIFWFDAGTSYSARNGGLARQPAGWIDLAMVSLVDGDATAEDIPVPFYDPDIERVRAEYYCQIVEVTLRGMASGGGQAYGGPMQWKEMRRTPSAVLILNPSNANVQDFQLYNLTRWGCRPEIVSAAAGDYYTIGRTYLLNAE